MDNRKIYDFIKGNMINFVVILISLAYVFYQQVIVERTDLTLEETLAKAGIGIIVGFLIKQGLGENGFNLGYRSEIWIDSMNSYGKACNSANEYIEYVDNFYYSEEIEKRKAYRRTNLTNARMKYGWFFDEFGNYNDVGNRYEKLTRYQKRVLNKCIKVKIYNLNLFSEYNNEIGADTHREKTDKQQRQKMVGKNSVSQILVAIVGAYFATSWANWDLGSFIMATVQVTCWVACGLMQLYTNYNYVVIEKNAKLKRKIELIIKFQKGCERGLYLVNPYDEIEKREKEANDERRKQDSNENESCEIGVISSNEPSCTDNLSNCEIQPIPNNNESENRILGDSSNRDNVISNDSNDKILSTGLENEIQSS